MLSLAFIEYSRHDEVIMDIALLAEVADHTVNVTQTGFGMGSALGIVCSWQRNRSILWAILAGLFSWFYVIYFALSRRPEETK